MTNGVTGAPAEHAAEQSATGFSQLERDRYLPRVWRRGLNRYANIRETALNPVRQDQERTPPWITKVEDTAQITNCRAVKWYIGIRRNRNGIG